MVGKKTPQESNYMQSDYLNGLLTALSILTRAACKIEMRDMTEQAWQIYQEVNDELLKLIKAEVDRMTK